ncbi:unnamed protein product [Rangifer tarandus platyrhynchus]|uniref:Uncharacterized protein n=1 Tax=Rangifer tarandus platyrhynchus TaxID=3082113 RepID=A0ABN8YAM1_RANTA|nr:unnamed protein product [Rangifer tarandus platyrhynchus]
MQGVWSVLGTRVLRKLTSGGRVQRRWAQNIAEAMPGKGSQDTWTRSREARRPGAQPDSEERGLCRCQHQGVWNRIQPGARTRTISTGTSDAQLGLRLLLLTALQLSRLLSPPPAPQVGPETWEVSHEVPRGESGNPTPATLLGPSSAPKPNSSICVYALAFTSLSDVASTATCGVRAPQAASLPRARGPALPREGAGGSGARSSAPAPGGREVALLHFPAGSRSPAPPAPPAPPAVNSAQSAGAPFSGASGEGQAPVGLGPRGRWPRVGAAKPRGTRLSHPQAPRVPGARRAGLGHGPGYYQRSAQKSGQGLLLGAASPLIASRLFLCVCSSGSSGGTFQKCSVPPPPPPHPPKAAWSRIAEAAALERTPSREQNLGHRQWRDQVGALGSPGSGQAVRQSPACPRESAAASACWLAPLHLTALAPTPPWRLPWGGYNSETVRIPPRHLAPHASCCC